METADAEPPAAPLSVGAISLAERVGADLDHGSEEWVESPDLVEIEPDELPRGKVSGSEGLVDAMHSGLMELESLELTGGEQEEQGEGMKRRQHNN